MRPRETAVSAVSLPLKKAESNTSARMTARVRPISKDMSVSRPFQNENRHQGGSEAASVWISPNRGPPSQPSGAFLCRMPEGKDRTASLPPDIVSGCIVDLAGHECADSRGIDLPRSEGAADAARQNERYPAVTDLFVLTHQANEFGGIGFVPAGNI
jgi:hypothetical protein